jgi:hypothetical protein
LHLREWVKPSYHLVISLPGDVPDKYFHDPSRAWIDRNSLWHNVISAMVREVLASTLIYRSEDFRH